MINLMSMIRNFFHQKPCITVSGTSRLSILLIGNRLCLKVYRHIPFLSQVSDKEGLPQCQLKQKTI